MATGSPQCGQASSQRWDWKAGTARVNTWAPGPDAEAAE